MTHFKQPTSRLWQPGDEAAYSTGLTKRAIFDLIRWTPEGISRAQIAERLSVSRPTVSTVVDQLLEAGLISEHGAGVSRGGRRPIVLKIAQDEIRVIGVDIGATHALVVLADLRGQTIASVEETVDVAQGARVTLDLIRDRVQQVVAKGNSDWSNIRAIAVGVPGPVISVDGAVSAPPIMPGWDSFPIRDYLVRHWGAIVTIDNDADLCALGEWAYGSERHELSMVYLKIGTGIGCGIMLDGRIYHGSLGTAGEIGHVTISPDGPPCTCGNYGCLEAMAGGRAIAHRAQLAVKAGFSTLLNSISPVEAITSKEVAEAAQQGDALSIQLLNDAGRHIGSAIATVINLLNPSLILIGGSVSLAGEALLTPMREAATKRSLRASMRRTKIHVGALGRNAAVMGAIALALSKVFQYAIDKLGHSGSEFS